MTDFLLTEALQRTARGLGVDNKSAATGGTTTTVVDTSQKSRWQNNAWKEGCLIITKTTDGAAPEGEFRRISGYVNSTTTFTVGTAFSVAPASGDQYMFFDTTYPYLQMIDFINDGLRSLDLLDLTDITTITIAGEKTEYAGAVAWKRSKPWKIERATDTDTNDYGWVVIPDWEYESAAAASTPLIIFKRQYSTTYTTIKVHYRDLHPIVDAYDDEIREEVHPELCVKAAVLKGLEWAVQTNQGEQESLNQLLFDARNEYDRALVRHPVTRSKPTKTAKTIEMVI